MYSRNICPKDCIHRENGICKYGYHVQNSIFYVEKKKCIYYASDFMKNRNKESTMQIQEIF